ncbi:MAG TPA: MYXO-CTERM sorting domain-containing protein [Kofleriaceae bacterium]|jgi:MYXO-CTERM domain-containing protein
MSFRRSVVVAGSLALTCATAQAFNPRSQSTARPAAQALTALPAAGITKPLREVADVLPGVATPAWTTFAAAMGGHWYQVMDRATGVPNRIWGSGLPAFGVMASAPTAEAVSRQLLAQHIALLAPGAAIGDFELVSNRVDNGLRVVGFVQKSRGLRVVGGQVSFRYKNDRLIAIGSEALPNVAFSAPRAKLSRTMLATTATSALRDALAMPNAPVSTPSDEVVLPLLGTDGVLGYRLARSVEIDGGVDGRYLAYADVASGAILAVKQQNLYATGTVLYKTVDRHPGRPRVDRPVPLAHIQVDGADATTAADGTVEVGAGATIATSVVGDRVKVVNQNFMENTPPGPLATTDLTLAAAGSVVWDETASDANDPQVNVYVNLNLIKTFVHDNLDAGLAFLPQQMVAKVNIASDCNAFWDGTAINFLRKSDACQNTGLVQDVLFHEFGHAVHQFEIIEGVGSFDGAMSEGAADFLSAIKNNDSAMGRGFRLTNGLSTEAPLREIDPPDKEYAWPRDIGEIHATGLIYSGALWDMRKDLISQFGLDEASRITDRIYIGTLRRSTSIPSSVFEALVEDDDDGNLDNGTPHECAIRKAFGKHGLRTTIGKVDAPGALATRAHSVQVLVDLEGLSTRCDSDEIDNVVVEWKGSGPTSPGAGQLDGVKSGNGRYYVQLPLAIEGKVTYRAQVNFADSTVASLPDNVADAFYQLYQGETVPLYCTNFDEDPFANGWTTGATAGTDTWQWGVEQGGTTDPPSAYSGDKLLGMNLAGDYEPNSTAYVKMPPIDVGNYSDVRLQYRRWLAVEDSYYDKARITVNDRQVWINSSANAAENSTLHHEDREWRFHDVPLSGWVPSHVLTVGWDLASDPGLSLGGWNLDDVCVVANKHSICGDGVVSSTEGCDEGTANSDAPDATCRSFCQKQTCGDYIVDSNEECDHGPAGDGFCTTRCVEIPTPSIGGPCSATGDQGGAVVWIGLGAVFVLRRRRKK